MPESRESQNAPKETLKIVSWGAAIGTLQTLDESDNMLSAQKPNSDTVGHEEEQWFNIKVGVTAEGSGSKC